MERPAPDRVFVDIRCQGDLLGGADIEEGADRFWPESQTPR